MFYREPAPETSRPTFASVADAAEMLGGDFKPHHIGQLVTEGEIESVEHEGRTLVVVTSLESYAKGLGR